MKLKQSVIISLVLALLLTTMIIGLSTIDKVDNIDGQSEEVVNVIPETFCKAINNAENVPSEVLDVIKSYMDDYYLSIYTLELQDTKKYFKNEIDGKVSDSAIKLIVETRKLYDFDMTMSDAGYVLNIISCSEINGKYYIDFLEDDYMSFKFLNGISSESYDIENSMIIEKVDEEFKISEFEKVQGYYMMFNDEKESGDMDSIYDFYFNRIKNTIEDENYKKELAASKEYVATKSFNVSYDRDAASKYAQTYYHSRNDKWWDFDDEGGNCQSFASQCLIAGGMLMDYDGDCRWFYNSYSDYVSPWNYVGDFYEYADQNEGPGLVCDVNTNIYYAQPGDIIQVGITSVSHTTIVSRIVDGHILLNSNSIDMKDYPLEAYSYPVRKLIKVLGSNS